MRKLIKGLTTPSMAWSFFLVIMLTAGREYNNPPAESPQAESHQYDWRPEPKYVDQKQREDGT